MHSGKPTPCIPHPALLNTTDVLPSSVVAKRRWSNCKTISLWAYRNGWWVKPDTVNRYYAKYTMWYLGQYPTGYMMRNHGLKKR